MPRFNSRAHEGRDRARLLLWRGLAVSIHAPTRGATYGSTVKDHLEEFQFTRPRGARLTPRDPFPLCLGFNSRAHEGRDLSRLPLLSARQFQFTRPRGARPGWISSLPSARSFNSRAHEGRDNFVQKPTIESTGFNSRAHEGRDTEPAIIDVKCK